MRILYVEDEKFLADAVIHILKKNKIDVDWTGDGSEGLDMAVQPIYDAIILDIMLPNMSGLDILAHLRKRGISTPIIMLSALSQVEDKIRGLEIGADDYLAKPFKTAELIARLNALVRRPPLQKIHELKFKDLTLNLDERTLNSVNLTDKEAVIMESLMTTPNSLLHKDHLVTKIWGEEGEDNYLEVYVSRLRRKLKNMESGCTIKTSRNLGYKICSKN